jgi:hypothetical protein
LNLEKSINNLSQRLNRISPETSNINLNDGILYWRGKKIILLGQWFQIKKDYGLKAALQFFPNEYPPFGLPCVAENIDDIKVKEDADKWYSEYKELMEFRRNPAYGHEKCFRCLLSPAREQSKLFIGIDIIIAKALERHYNILTSPNSPSIYPCKVLNIFECPYATDNTNEEKTEVERGEKLSAFDTSDLFDLSEIAFQLELAFARAQLMTKSNDTTYEANFETGKVRQFGHFSDTYDLFAHESLEERLAEVKGLSKVPIRSRDDIYHALKDKETLDKVLEQGLDEEHQKYREKIVEICMSIKDSVLKEGGDNACASYNNGHQKQKQHMNCSICQGFANIHCINCKSIWLCVDHWKQHRDDEHDGRSSSPSLITLI